MGMTLTQKLKKRAVREGQYDFTARRGGSHIEISTLTKRTKTKQEKIEKETKKHRKSDW